MPTLGALRKVNLLAASMYGLVSLWVCSSYQLWGSHPVGHAFPAASAVVTAIWGLHCWQLGVAVGVRGASALRSASIPVAISVLAAIACWYRYMQQI